METDLCATAVANKRRREREMARGKNAGARG